MIKIKGGKFNDIFHGADGNDYIEGNYRNDRLYGDDGDNYVSEEAGNASYLVVVETIN